MAESKVMWGIFVFTITPTKPGYELRDTAMSSNIAWIKVGKLLDTLNDNQFIVMRLVEVVPMPRSDVFTIRKNLPEECPY